MPGKVLKVVARDPAAHFDLLAWCSMTNDTMVYHDAVAQSWSMKARLSQH